MCLLQVISLLKGNLQIKREMTVSAASRVMTGPEVLGCRPVLATFQEFKDRDEVLRKAGVFKGNNIHVTEDMSRLCVRFYYDLVKDVKLVLRQSLPRIFV